MFHFYGNASVSLAPWEEGIKSGRLDNSGKTPYLPLVGTE